MTSPNPPAAAELPGRLASQPRPSWPGRSGSPAESRRAPLLRPLPPRHDRRHLLSLYRVDPRGFPGPSRARDHRRGRVAAGPSRAIRVPGPPWPWFRAARLPGHNGSRRRGLGSDRKPPVARRGPRGPGGNQPGPRDLDGPPGSFDALAELRIQSKLICACLH